MPVTWTEVPLFELEPLPGPDENVQAVWQFWLTTLRYNSATRVVMSDKRRRKIEMALEKYDLQTCFDAISGCAISEFHQGRNGFNKKYDDIELILRDPEHIERFSTEYRESKQADW